MRQARKNMKKQALRFNKDWARQTNQLCTKICRDVDKRMVHVLYGRVLWFKLKSLISVPLGLSVSIKANLINYSWDNLSRRRDKLEKLFNTEHAQFIAQATCPFSFSLDGPVFLNLCWKMHTPQNFNLQKNAINYFLILFF